MRPAVSDHLSIRPEGSGPGEVHFALETREGRLGGALGTSLAAHGGLLLAYFLAVWLAPEPVRDALVPDRLENIVWLADPGPGGGGGGGNQMPDPPRPAEVPRQEERNQPPPPPRPTPEPVPEPPEPLNIPARTLGASQLTLPGVLESTQASASLGAGTGSGAGAGRGSGLGPGFGGGTGGGAFRPGNGVVTPMPIREVKPQYTADAMRAKVQGTVLLECVVLPDGSVGEVDVVKSLDQNFGLDEEAVKAAKQWRFRPGTRFGEPVAVLVTIELTFTLR